MTPNKIIKNFLSIFLKNNTIRIMLLLLIVIIGLIIAGFIRTPYIETKNNEIRIKFLETLKRKVEKIIIYQKYPKSEITIENTNLIDSIIHSTSRIYGTSDIGRFEQDYLIVLKFINDYRTYSFEYNKKCYNPSACYKYIEYNGERINNPYNDCGQITLFENPQERDKEYFDNIHNTILSFENIDLIPILNRIDNIVKDGKQKDEIYIK